VIASLMPLTAEQGAPVERTVGLAPRFALGYAATYLGIAEAAFD
jgi:hypothetical protein